MVTFPITVKKSLYRGSDARKKAKALELNGTAARLESFINDKLKNQIEPIRIYSYFEISRETGVPESVVRDLCFSIDCGHNGFTAIKAGLSFDEAWQQHNGG